MTRIIGVDPGVNGAIAVYDGMFLVVHDFPIVKSKGKGNDIDWGHFAFIFNEFYCNIDHAYLELVHAMPGNASNSVFKFGAAFGGIKAILSYTGIPLTLVTPSKWKGKLNLTKDKDYSRTRAMELFPKLAEFFKRKKDNNRAEAALIAWYGYQQLMGNTS